MKAPRDYWPTVYSREYVPMMNFLGGSPEVVMPEGYDYYEKYDALGSKVYITRTGGGIDQYGKEYSTEHAVTITDAGMCYEQDYRTTNGIRTSSGPMTVSSPPRDLSTFNKIDYDEFRRKLEESKKDKTKILPMQSSPPVTYTPTAPEVKTYQDYYWDYVNAKDPYSAQEALSAMLDKVTEYQEPNTEMTSWVEEPKATVAVVKRTFSVTRWVTETPWVIPTAGSIGATGIVSVIVELCLGLHFI